MTESKLIAKIKSDPRVDSISDERDYRGSQLNDPQVKEHIERTGENGDGFWIYLKLGWLDQIGTGCHQIHETSIEECLNLLKHIRKCECDECKPEAVCQS